MSRFRHLHSQLAARSLDWSSSKVRVWRCIDNTGVTSRPPGWWPGPSYGVTCGTCLRPEVIETFSAEGLWDPIHHIVCLSLSGVCVMIISLAGWDMNDGAHLLHGYCSAAAWSMITHRHMQRWNVAQSCSTLQMGAGHSQVCRSQRPSPSAAQWYSDIQT